MMRIRRFFQLIVFCLTAPAAIACADSGEATDKQAPSRTVAFIESDNARHRFNVEYVVEHEALMRGLMHRTELAPDAGMLFDFREERPIAMWMKNTLISLDIAFIDKKGVIVRIAENTTPLSLDNIPADGPVSVLGVLEVNAGTFEALGVEVGDRVRHPMFEAPASP